MAGAPPPVPFPPPPAFPAPYTHFSAGMAIIIVVLVSAFFIMGFFSVYVKRCATSEYEAQLAQLRDPARAASSRPEPGLDKALYEAFPLVEYSELKSFKTAKETTECVVCLSDFEDEENLRLLPKCGHFFHPECIDAWFQNHTTCPLCRCSLGPPAEVATARGGGGFWGSGRLTRRPSSNNVEQAEAAPESTSNGDVVVTIQDQDAIDLEQLRAFLRAGSVRGQSGRRGASFRMATPAADTVSADSKLDDALSGNEASSQQPRPGEAELMRSLSRNSLSFRQAVRGVELREYLSGSSASPVDPIGKLQANTAPDETPGGAILQRSTSMGRLGSSSRRSSSLNAWGGSQRLPRDGEDLLTLVETSQEFARFSQEFPAMAVESRGFVKSEDTGSDDSGLDHEKLATSAPTQERALKTGESESKADEPGNAG